MEWRIADTFTDSLARLTGMSKRGEGFGQAIGRAVLQRRYIDL